MERRASPRRPATVAPRRAARRLLVALILAAPTPAMGQGLALDIELLTQNLVRPVGVVDAGDGSGRLFLVQQTGEILVWNGASVEATPYLDLSGVVQCCGEQGLLGLAFHPDYETNGELFVNYTLPGGDTAVARYEVSAGDPDVADAGSGDVILTYDQPAGNHNGGHMAFGPDGYLYIASGDGGGGGDPQERAQDLSLLLGKLLRLDVDETDPGLEYSIPATNPFAAPEDGARDEIWAWGLRNPWRFSFDRATGDLWIGDVGQNAWEEVDLQPAASTGGENYGWDCREGAHDYVPPLPDDANHCPLAGPVVEPVLEYAHASGRCSVTGGFRYRGDDEPRLRGVYLFADLCTGEVFGTVPRCDGVWESRPLVNLPFLVTTFGEDGAGELFVAEYAGTNDPNSAVHRLVLAVGSGGPDLSPSDTGLDFGTVEVGDTVSLPLTLTNANAGPEAALAAGQLSDPARFSLALGDGVPPCPSPDPCLAPGTSCSLTVRFQGDAPGTVAETLVYDGNFVAETVALAAEVVPCASDVDLVVSGLTVPSGGDETRRACDTLTAGPDVTVEAGGELTLQAGTRIALGDGFAVEAGGTLRLEIF